MNQKWNKNSTRIANAAFIPCGGPLNGHGGAAPAWPEMKAEHEGDRRRPDRQRLHGQGHALAWNAVKPVFGDVPDIRLVHLGDADDELAQRQGATSSASSRASATGARDRRPGCRRRLDHHAEQVPSGDGDRGARGGKACLVREADGAEPADAETHAGGGRGPRARSRCSATTTSRTRSSGTSGKLLDEGAIGPVNHVRIEMDEDFLADPEAPFQQRHEASNGWGALDDFGVHPLSLILTLFGRRRRASCATWPSPIRRGSTPDGERDGRGLRHRHHR